MPSDKSVFQGVSRRGSANGASKLTADDVREIREDYPGTSTAELAARYKVNRRTVYGIIARETWDWLD